MNDEQLHDEPDEGVEPLRDEDEEAGVEPLDPDDLDAAPDDLEDEWEDEESYGE